MRVSNVSVRLHGGSVTAAIVLFDGPDDITREQFLALAEQHCDVISTRLVGDYGVHLQLSGVRQTEGVEALVQQLCATHGLAERLAPAEQHPTVRPPRPR